MSRRDFLALGGASVAVAGAGVATLERARSGPQEPAEAAANPRRAPAADRVLVVVQCGGGNDALNTVVPVADGRYHDARPGLALDDDELVPLSGVDDHALHASLSALSDTWDAGRLAVVQRVGFRDQGRSHFESMATWWSGGDPGAPTGWLGRWLDLTMADGDHPLRALAIGGGAPALRATRAASTSVGQLQGFAFRGPTGTDDTVMRSALTALANADHADETHAAVARSLGAAGDAVDAIGAVVDPAGDTRRTRTRPASGAITASLDQVADLIEAGLPTRVYVIGAGGFDTHATQAPTHARLLADLGDAVGSFVARLDASGNGDRILVMTTSEFGRRVAENGSGGTDHGAATSLLLAGPAVVGGIVGDHGLGDLADGDLRPDIDPRAVYAAGLSWLGGPVADVVGPTEDLGLLSV